MNKFTTLSCASYYGSGSSAVLDYLTEFKDVYSLTNYEFRFAHDPDGLSELEYNLVENFNRHNSGHALKRYKKMVDYFGNHIGVKRYESFFNGKWKEYSYEYIEKLTDFSYPGRWQYDFYDRGAWYEFWAKLPDRILHRTIWRNKPDRCLFFGNCKTYASHPSEEYFLECTKEYTSKLLKEANSNEAKFLLVDQIVPSTNIDRHVRYFENLKVFVVDRDPRDIYLLSKYVWKDEIVPKDIDLFCKWYKYTRSTQKDENWENENKLFIQFEDMIYKYDETCEKIRNWVGVNEEDHIRKKEFFIPEVSIKNTQYWISHPDCQEETEYIEKNLSEYLYDFPI